MRALSVALSRFSGWRDIWAWIECPDSLHVGHRIAGNTTWLFGTVFDLNSFFQRCFQLVKKLTLHLIFP